MKDMSCTHEVTFRPAQPEDASIAAQLIILSMRDEATVLFGSENLRSVLEKVCHLFIQKDGRFSHKFSTIAEVGHQPVGLLLTYPGQIIARLDLITGKQLLQLFGLREMVRLVLRILPYSVVREAERFEYYISNLAVLARFQGQKIGTCLLAYAEMLARNAGFRKCSLLVELDNYGARRLYAHQGYKSVSTKRVPNKRETGLQRMVKDLVVLKVAIEEE